MQLSPTAADVHHEQLELVQSLCEVISSQLEAAVIATTTKEITALKSIMLYKGSDRTGYCRKT
jgi:hypothetical protein